MANSLGLGGDVDDVGLLKQVEDSFGISISGPEAGALQNVGDIYALLLRRFVWRDAGACATAMAFYRLRHALSGSQAARRLRPATPLAELGAGSPKAFFRRLADQSGLRLPSAVGTGFGTIGLVLSGVGSLALLGVWISLPAFWLVPASAIALGAIMMRLDPGQFADGNRNLGDLARQVAALNFGRLVHEGAAPRDKALWDALVEILASESGLPKADIGPETLLLA